MVTRRDRLVRHPALFFVAIRAVKQSRRISKAENIGSGRPGGLRYGHGLGAVKLASDRMHDRDAGDGQIHKER
ncbi:hypothetical protein [Burkholderia pseudomultivorans]|uniref:hypothetical protein n=1 Tax=Burkholderia pseudomultivorans TaxID=1207504 RepID=UPI000A88186E|nr:hypothetical protein [Burkholderia pseudomultivorans]